LPIGSWVNVSAYFGIVCMVTKGKGEAEGMSDNIELAKRILAKHEDFIRSTICFHIKNEADADDIFQDLIIYLISKPMPKDIRNKRAFLYKVISARAKDAFRKKTCYRRNIQKYAQSCRYTVDKSPVDVMIEADEVKKMLGLIRHRLPSRQFLAIKLRYKKDLENSKAAKKMGIKYGSVTSYVSVGLKSLRDIFKKPEGGDYDSI